MKARIHVNQHIIRANGKTGARDPVMTIKTYKGNTKAREVLIKGATGEVIARIIYSPDKPLPCGAKVWIETDTKRITTK